MLQACRESRCEFLAARRGAHGAPVAWRAVLARARPARRLREPDREARSPSKPYHLHAIHGAGPNVGLRRRGSRDRTPALPLSPSKASVASYCLRTFGGMTSMLPYSVPLNTIFALIAAQARARQVAEARPSRDSRGQTGRRAVLAEFRSGPRVPRQAPRWTPRRGGTGSPP